MYDTLYDGHNFKAAIYTEFQGGGGQIIFSHSVTASEGHCLAVALHSALITVLPKSLQGTSDIGPGAPSQLTEDANFIAVIIFFVFLLFFLGGGGGGGGGDS